MPISNSPLVRPSGERSATRGQSCSSVERLYVEESAADELTRKIIEKTRQLKQDTGDKETTSVAAMSSERQIKIVEDHVEDFRAAGAKIEIGGPKESPTSMGSLRTDSYHER
jgi:acyl-CoA reductase-like NAD-dependent aldehyde dehydrogenase